VFTIIWQQRINL